MQPVAGLRGAELDRQPPREQAPGGAAPVPQCPEARAGRERLAVQPAQVQLTDRGEVGGGDVHWLYAGGA